MCSIPTKKTYPTAVKRKQMVLPTVRCKGSLLSRQVLFVSAWNVSAAVSLLAAESAFCVEILPVPC